MSYINVCGDWHRIPLESVCRGRIQLRDTDIGGDILFYHERKGREYIPSLRYIPPEQIEAGTRCSARGIPIRAVRLCIHYTTRYCLRRSRSSNIALDVRLCTVLTNRMLRDRWERVKRRYGWRPGLSPYRQIAMLNRFYRDEIVRIRRLLWERLSRWMSGVFGNICIGYESEVVEPGSIERMRPATVYIGYSQTVSEVPIDVVYGIFCRCLRGELDKCRRIYEDITRIEESRYRFARWLRK